MVPSPPPNRRPVNLVHGGHLGSRLASALMALDVRVLCVAACTNINTVSACPFGEDRLD